MFIEIEANKAPIYEQVYEGLKKLILDQTLKEGDRLPSLRSLARDCNVSLNTVKNAYLLLEKEGYIQSEEKIGYFVKATDHLVQLSVATTQKKTPEKSPSYDFSYGGVDPSSFPFSIWRKIFQEIFVPENDKLLSSGHPQGHPPLREAIAQYLKKSRGVSAQANQIIISSGTDQLFYLLRLLLPEDTTYAFEDPGFAWGSPHLIYGIKNPLPLRLDKEGPVLEAVLKTKKCGLLLTPAHQFPLGVIMTDHRRQEVLKWLEASPHRYVIEDDYDGEFKFQGHPVPPLKTLDKKDQIIYIGSFSKSLTPSLRISYMVLPQDLLLKYHETLAHFSSPVSPITQKALALFIQGGYFDRHLNRMRGIYSKRYDRILAECKKLKDVHILASESGMSFVIHCPKIKSSQDLLKKAQAQGLNLTSVQEFQSDPKEDKKLFILGFAKLTEKEIQEGIGLLDQILEGETP
ncbi:MAG: PLP-dependent aminotransferase family protein [Tissierellia bacterium]|nr:PLP-dependent aminotransferase family protein [Tissierellia bacterium]